MEKLIADTISSLHTRLSLLENRANLAVKRERDVEDEAGAAAVKRERDEEDEAGAAAVKRERDEGSAANDAAKAEVEEISRCMGLLRKLCDYNHSYRDSILRAFPHSSELIVLSPPYQREEDAALIFGRNFPVVRVLNKKKKQEILKYCFVKATEVHQDGKYDIVYYKGSSSFLPRASDMVQIRCKDEDEVISKLSSMIFKPDKSRGEGGAGGD